MTAAELTSWDVVQAKKVACEAARHAFARVLTRADADYATREARVLVDALMDFLEAVDEHREKYALPITVWSLVGDAGKSWR